MREIGGLYVLGTERHESRRIDNQLRGRAGRQGDQGESRFYLSLEDELMRLFATGLMSRVMNASFPDDMPLESKMVSRAVERAQGTVEDRNFEIRKNVLKYDEVMNEQRKVIYKRRQQILDGENLEEEAILAIESAISRLVAQHCLGEYFEDWDVPGLLDAARLYYPTRITKEQIDEVIGREALEELFVDDATTLYAEKGEAIGARHAARHRAPGDALGDRPALARAPLRDGLPAGGHQPAGHGPAGPALGVAAGRLRHVRGHDGPDRGRLRPLRLPSPGRRRRRARARHPQRVVQRAVRPGAGFRGDRGGSRRPGRGDAARVRRRRCRRARGGGRASPCSRCPSAPRRRPAATSRASAGAARSTSSAMGDEVQRAARRAQPESTRRSGK